LIERKKLSKKLTEIKNVIFARNKAKKKNEKLNNSIYLPEKKNI
jgi:hypothetical protein